MLALISFLILSLWTTFLGILNYSQGSIQSSKESNIVEKKAALSELEDCSIVSAASTPQNLSTSEISKAFKNLWDELSTGF